MVVEVLPVLADRRCLQTVRLGLGNPLLTCFRDGDARSSHRGMQALLHLDHRPRQPSGRLFLRLEGLDMPLWLTVPPRRGVLGDPGALFAPPCSSTFACAPWPSAVRRSAAKSSLLPTL